MAWLPHDCDWPLPPGIPSISSLEARGAPADAEQIEKDLHRAGRQALGVTDADAEAHRDALRRVLYAWCWCSDSGYSQAMSHIGASLLVAATHDVDGAFLSFAWLMRTLPSNYYDEGCRVEVRALRILAALRWPEVIDPALYEALDLVMGQWLLSVWVGALPREDCLAVWAQMVRDDVAPADTSLRVGLVLLATALVEIHEAATADAADEDALGTAEMPSLGCATYAALQAAAQWRGGGAALVAATLTLELDEGAVAAARSTAALQLRAEAEARGREAARARALTASRGEEGAHQTAEPRSRRRDSRREGFRTAGIPGISPPREIVRGESRLTAERSHAEVMVPDALCSRRVGSMGSMGSVHTPDRDGGAEECGGGPRRFRAT